MCSLLLFTQSAAKLYNKQKSRQRGSTKVFVNARNNANRDASCVESTFHCGTICIEQHTYLVLGRVLHVFVRQKETQLKKWKHNKQVVPSRTDITRLITSGTVRSSRGGDWLGLAARHEPGGDEIEETRRRAWVIS
jgi:hypothetical protein